MECNSPKDIKDCVKYVSNRGGGYITGFWVIFQKIQNPLVNSRLWINIFFSLLTFNRLMRSHPPTPRGHGLWTSFLWSLQRKTHSFRKQSSSWALVINFCWTDAPQSNSMFYWMKGKTTPKYIHWCLLLSYAKYSINYDTACILDNINASLQKMWQGNPQLLLR